MTIGIAVNLVALAALLLLVLWWGRRPTEAVRLRNALRLQPSRGEDFSWVPPQYPPGFAVERREPGAEFQAIVASVGVDTMRGDWVKALALSAHLTERAQEKGPVRDDPSSTYRAIRNGYGYCADFVKVFLVLAHAAGLDARQWAFSFDGFGGHGHTFVEVFDRERRKWLFIDVYNNFHAVDPKSGEPLGALEFRDALLGRRETALLRPNGPGRPGFVLEQKAVDYYRDGIDQWYLIWGNSAYSYYMHPLVRWSGRVSRGLSHLAANVVGAQPHIRIYSTPENRVSASRMFALRRRLQWAAIAGLLLIVVLAMQLATVGAPGRVGA